jgi:hypothetical protein
MNKTWSEFSKEFIDEYPDLYDRVLMNVKVNIEYELEVHSGYTEEDILNRVIQDLFEGAKYQYELKITPPYKEN